MAWSLPRKPISEVKNEAEERIPTKGHHTQDEACNRVGCSPGFTVSAGVLQTHDSEDDGYHRQDETDHRHQSKKATIISRQRQGILVGDKCQDNIPIFVLFLTSLSGSPVRLRFFLNLLRGGRRDRDHFQHILGLHRRRGRKFCPTLLAALVHGRINGMALRTKHKECISFLAR
jgi:hypothetical protein